jgi:DNA-binding XRE family transcriptional regulator
VCHSLLGYHPGMDTTSRAPRPELVRLRRQAELTQQQLADALGLQSARPIKAWERGDYAPSITQALPLARVLGVSLEEVVLAIAGPDQESAQDIAPGIPTETLAALSHHVTALARLVRQLEQAEAMARPNPAADAGQTEASASASPAEAPQDGERHDT